MHLFISDHYTITNQTITIMEDRIIHQCSRVLRMKLWEQIQLQNQEIRYTIQLTEFSKKELQGTIIQKEHYQLSNKKTTIAVALPNRRDKAELITQKLTEIGVSHIIFFPTQRSIFKTTPDKKQDRIQQIALEATEQSFRTSLPTITFLEKRDEKSILWQKVVFFHQGGSPLSLHDHHNEANLFGIVWPEWWFTDQEVSYFSSLGSHHTLGDTILRMETAAIIWSRLLHNR